MEDAEQLSLGDATGPPHGAFQFGQGPVELLGLLGLDCDAGFVLLLCGHSVAAHAHC